MTSTVSDKKVDETLLQGLSLITSMVKRITSPDLEPEPDPAADKFRLEAARKLGKFIDNNKDKIQKLLEDEAVRAYIEKGVARLAAAAEADPATRMIELKKLRLELAAKLIRELPKSGSRIQSLFTYKDKQLKEEIEAFLKNLYDFLMNGDFEQLKTLPQDRLFRLSAEEVVPVRKQLNKLFVVSDGAVYQTDKLIPKLQKQFDQAQELYNLTEQTTAAPPKIVKTPAQENLSRIFPNNLVLFKTDLAVATVVASTVYKRTPAQHPRVYAIYGTPPPNWQSDAYFMEQRLVGVNPHGISKITEEQKKLFQGSGIQFEGRKYFTWDFRVLESFATRELPASVLLAEYVESQRSLQPLAVWVSTGRESGLKPVVIKKDDGEAQWELAKMSVRVSEWNVHELGSHLTLCHIVCEMFCVLTHHYLPQQHPVFQLLLPHFFRTIPLNDGARATLLPDIIAEKLSSISTEEALKLCSKMLSEWDFQENYIPSNLKNRGVLELPNSAYPFKKTALDTWKSIREYVENSLKTLAEMSASESQRTILDNDKLLRTWTVAMSRFFKNFPKLDEDNTNDGLYDAITLMIFTASHQHAAVNYYQEKYMSFLPAAPGRMKEFPGDVKSLTKDKVLGLLPSYQTGVLQTATVKMLSSEPDANNTLVGFDRKANKSAVPLSTWPELDNNLLILQGQLKNLLSAYSINSVNQKNLAQSVLI